MMNSRKWIGYAVIAQALLFVIVPINLTFIQGSRFQPADFSNPDVLMNTANWPVLGIAPLVQFAISIAILLTAIGLYDLYNNDAPLRMRLSFATAVIASTLILVSGMNEFMRFYALDIVPADLRVSALSTFDLIRFTTRNSGFFALGCSMVLWGGTIYNTNAFPKALGILIILAGILGLLIIPFQPIGIIVTALWSVWLGALFVLPGK